MITIYGYSPSGNCHKLRMLLGHLGRDYRWVETDSPHGATRTAAYLAKNPNGKVPMIVHDGTPIWESAAITMYLGETYGVEKGLYPRPGPKRGEAMKWIVWGNVTLADAVGRWLREGGAS